MLFSAARPHCFAILYYTVWCVMYCSMYFVVCDLLYRMYFVVCDLLYRMYFVVRDLLYRMYCVSYVLCSLPPPNVYYAQFCVPTIARKRKEQRPARIRGYSLSQH